MTTVAELEALLFTQSEGMQVADIATLLETSEEEVEETARLLAEALCDRGVQLAMHDGLLQLRSMPLRQSLAEKLLESERQRELGKAALETLAIILYHRPATRGTIERLRGVSAASTPRSLQIRGLVERRELPTSARQTYYAPTLELLAHLGLTRIEDLPGFEEAGRDIATFLEREESSSLTS